MFKKLSEVKNRLSPSLRQVLSNTSWLFTDRMLQMGMGLLIGVWVARYLGTEKFGLLNQGMVLGFIFSPLATLGLDGIVVRDLARNADAEQRDKTLGTVFVLKLAGGFLAVIFAVLAAYLQKEDNKTLLLVGILAAGNIFQAFTTIEFLFRSQLQAKVIVVAKRSIYILISVVKVVLILSKAPLLAFAWVATAETAFSALALVIAYHVRGYRLLSWRISWQRAQELLLDSWPLFLASLSTYVYSKVDQVMLGFSSENKTELAYYAVAVKLSETFDFLPMSINSSLLPKLTEIKQKSEETYQKNFQRYIDIMMVLWLGVAIPMCFASPFIVKTLYGASYAPAGAILSLYTWAQFGSNFGVARSTYMLIENKQKWSLFFTITGAGINILLNLYMIPLYGAWGATLATLITYFLVIVVFNFVIADLRPVGYSILRACNLRQSFLRIRELTR